MEQLAHFLTLFSATAAGSLVGAVWQGAILAAAVAFCLHFVKGISAGVRSILWTAVFLLVAAMHCIPFLHGHAAPTGSASTLHLDLRWSVGIACAWGVLSLVRAVQLVHGAIGLRRSARGATPVQAPPECAALLHTRYRSAELCTSTDVDRPSVIGFFRPRILIPQALFEKITPSELEQIVMHEMEHLRRADDWTNLIQKISLVLFPLNPVLLFVERRLCVERELACDDRVLHLTRARKAYATCLVNLAEHSVLHRGASLVLGAWERQSELARRVRRILTPSEGMMGRRKMQFVTSALLAGTVGGALTLAREPQLVSFVPQTGLSSEVAIVPTSISSSGYAPVSFRANPTAPKMPGFGVPKMTDTVFHEPAHDQTKAAAATKPRPRKAVRTMLKSTAYPVDDAVRRRPQPQALIVLTDWTDSPLPSRLRLVVSGEVYSYAAVPTPNGWLIVQL